jgi:hypothetical protein
MGIHSRRQIRGPVDLAGLLPCQPSAQLKVNQSWQEHSISPRRPRRHGHPEGSTAKFLRDARPFRLSYLTNSTTTSRPRPRLAAWTRRITCTTSFRKRSRCRHRPRSSRPKPYPHMSSNAAFPVEGGFMVAVPVRSATWPWSRQLNSLTGEQHDFSDGRGP